MALSYLYIYGVDASQVMQALDNDKRDEPKEKHVFHPLSYFSIGNDSLTYGETQDQVWTLPFVRLTKSGGADALHYREEIETRLKNGGMENPRVALTPNVFIPDGYERLEGGRTELKEPAPHTRKGYSPNWGGKREGAGRHKKLPNGCEIIRRSGIEVGLIMTEVPGKPEAWLWWCEGQSLVGDQGMLWGTREQAVMRVNAWLEGIGLALSGGEIMEH